MSEEELFTEWVGTGYDAYKINYKKEYEKLNNIINELEKYCNEEIEDYDKAISSKILSEIGRDKYEAEKMCFLDMLDKLQELKGDKNNDN